jgi:hypothetical protein
MKIRKNRRTVLVWHFSPRPGTVVLAQHSGPVGPRQPALRASLARSPRGGHARGSFVARPARLRRWPRCTVPGRDAMGEQRLLRQARWDDEVLTGDVRWRRSGENGPVRRRSKVAVELRLPGRVSMSLAVGGGDGE